MDTLLKSFAPRTLIMMMGGICMLIAAALISYVLWPEFTEYRKSSYTLKSLEETVANVERLDEEIESLEKEITMLDQNLHGGMMDLPDSQMEAYIIGRLQEISWKNNIKLLGVRPAQVTTITSLEEIPFNVEVSGDYFDLYAWLQDLGTELVFVAIRHFIISPQNSAKAIPDLKASLTLVSYREAENG